MPRKPREKVVCQICKREVDSGEAVLGDAVRPNVVEIILRNRPDWSPSEHICMRDLNGFRGDYVREALQKEKGELTSLEKSVLEGFREHELMSKDVNREFEKGLTIGERLADKVAEFGGSWSFITVFGAFIFTWIILNSVALLAHPFDPYPYILLNLFLSTLAALQAPIIMMSQNRLAARDRLRAEQDYIVNLKAELEIRHLNEKMDHLLTHQWQRLMEIQEIQTEALHELTRGKGEREQYVAHHPQKTENSQDSNH